MLSKPARSSPNCRLPSDWPGRSIEEGEPAGEPRGVERFGLIDRTLEWPRGGLAKGMTAVGE
jgi:hypothetical protein